MKKARTYFYWTKLETGEYVNLIYESTYRKNTWDHIIDLRNAIYDKKIKLAVDTDRITKDEYIYILNDKNKRDECFDDYRAIDLR